MKAFRRLNAPEFLSENAERWNRQWSELKHRNPGAIFHWYQHDGRPVNHHFAPILSEQTQGHCSYCDGYPLGPADHTIDHFKPKGDPRFYLEAYQWENLFWACADCQIAKREKFDDLLLKPDQPGFSFGKYFIYNFNTHQIEINPLADDDSRQKAEITCRIFDLNHPSRTISRRHSFERWSANPQQPLEDFSFRFIFE